MGFGKMPAWTARYIVAGWSGRLPPTFSHTALMSRYLGKVALPDQFACNAHEILAEVEPCRRSLSAEVQHWPGGL